jgi:hypothetical protein
MNKWKIVTFALTALFMSMYMLGTVSSQAEEPQYQDAEVLVDLSLLPGVRINLNINQDIDVFEDETTHVQHGFVSNTNWSDMSAAEQTEFLSTTKFRFFHSNEEVPLNHIIRYDTQDGHMYSMFYRVFPPGFFPVGQNQIRGEWTWLESGSWIIYEDTGTVKVTKTVTTDEYEPNNNVTVATDLGTFSSWREDIETYYAEIMPSTDVDWYHFYAFDETTPSPMVVVRLTITPSEILNLDVWKSDTDNFSDAIKVYSGTYFKEKGGAFVDNSAYYWVRVYYVSGDLTYERYGIQVSHNYYK